MVTLGENTGVRCFRHIFLVGTCQNVLLYSTTISISRMTQLKREKDEEHAGGYSSWTSSQITHLPSTYLMSSNPSNLRVSLRVSERGDSDFQPGALFTLKNSEVLQVHQVAKKKPQTASNRLGTDFMSVVSRSRYLSQPPLNLQPSMN